MPSPILARADALMQRRHLNNAGSEEVPVLTDAIDNDDDIPVLSDIAGETSPHAPLAPALAVDPASAPKIQDDTPLATEEIITDAAATPAATLPAALLDELGRRIEQRLQAELPAIIAATLHDFLSEHEIPATPRQD